MKPKNLIMIILLMVFSVVGYNSMYVVDETEQTMLLQFGKIVGETQAEAGLKFKVPFIQQVYVYPKTLLEWDGDKGEIPTLDKTYIWVDVFARWKIADPVKFFKTTRTVRNAQVSMSRIIESSVKNAIASHPLIEAVRNSNRKFALVKESSSGAASRSLDVETGREELTKIIDRQARPKLRDFGIELVDVKIKRINYRDDVRRSVYDRMIEERIQVVEKHRSEGKGEAEKIRGLKEKELKSIRSSAYRKAQLVKGAADAEATRIFAEAYSQDPEFYSFVKTMDVYKTTLGKDSSIVMSTDSEFLKYFKERQ